MSRCLLGEKKLRKIRNIIGPAWECGYATVRGGNPHFWATSYLRERVSGRQIIAYVNYKTGEIDWPEPGAPFSTWADAPGGGKAVAIIDAGGCMRPLADEVIHRL